MTICLLVVTDGREDYLTESVASALANLDGPITEQVMFDDTGDPDYREHLAVRFPTFDLIHAGPRQGFGGAIQAAWSYLAERSHARFVWHHEQDFTYNRPVDLEAIAATLDDSPQLVQLALRRQPWNEHERLAGGIVEQHPDAYVDCFGPHGAWLEQRMFFTTNPSLYRRSLCSNGWPEGANTEGRFSHQLMQSDEAVRFGFWGARDSGEWVNHIGRERVGMGY